MRVLFADKLPDEARARLADTGFDVHVDATLSGDALTVALGAVDPDVVVVRSTKFTAADVAAAKGLSLVVRAGAGVNNIDLASCAARGVFVSNCPGKNAVAVAELTIGLLLALDRRIADNVADARAGRWNKAGYSKAQGVKGRTLGVLGLGRIGREVVSRAKALGMHVVAWSRSLDERDAGMLGIRRMSAPRDVAAACDVLSVHLALTDDTRGLVSADVLAALPDGAFFLNTSRAEVVDEAALTEAIASKGLWCGLDVFAGEPSSKTGELEHPLAGHPQVYLTHHIGASTTQAQHAVADEACRVIETYRRTGTAPNCVNLAARTTADHTLVVRHLDRVGVLAAVLELLRQAHINVQDMDNIIFAGGEAASARIQIHGAPDDDVLQRMRDHDDILHVACVPI